MKNKFREHTQGAVCGRKYMMGELFTKQLQERTW